MFERLAARMYIEQATASFRAYRVDTQGRVVDRCSAARGILAVEGGDFAGVLAEQIGPWLAQEPGAVFMSGMIGSFIGSSRAPSVSA